MKREIEDIDKEVSLIKQICYNMENELKPLNEKLKNYSEELMPMENRGRKEAISFLRERVETARMVTYAIDGLIRSLLSSSDRINRIVEEMKRGQKKDE